LDNRALIAKIEAAKSDLTEAEVAIEALLAELRVKPRAEKMTVSAALESAFAKLRAARANLESLEVDLRAGDKG
jgi:hypothetical protein